MLETGRPVGLVNARVITMDAVSSVREAVAFRGNRIVATGTSNEIAGLLGPDALVLDCEGRAVMPGLIDAHAHLDREGLKDQLPGLQKMRSISDVLDAIFDLARSKSPGEWIVTMPIGDPPFYDDPRANLIERRWPNRKDLDRVAPNNPVYIRAPWGWWHGRPPIISIANTAALRAVGLDRNSQALSDKVVFERDEDGELTGVFIEHAFMPILELISFLEPCRFSPEQRRDALKASVRKYNACGTTGVFEGHGVAAEVVDAYQALAQENELNIRAHLVHSIPWALISKTRIEEILTAPEAGARKFLSPLVMQGDYAVQCGADPLDAIRARAHPYTGWAGFYYGGGLNERDLAELLSDMNRYGLRPVSVGVSALPHYYRAAKENLPLGRRWTIGHVGVLSYEQIDQLAEIGACVTTHTNRFLYKQGSEFSNTPCCERGAANGGRWSPAELVPLRSLVNRGIVAALGTDNVPISMFYPIWQAVARICMHCGSVIGKEERLTRMEALRAATMGGAYLSFQENVRGSLEAGKLADIIVLNADPLSVVENSIRDIVADITIVDGRVVFDRHDEMARLEAAANEQSGCGGGSLGT